MAGLRPAVFRHGESRGAEDNEHVSHHQFIGQRDRGLPFLTQGNEQIFI